MALKPCSECGGRVSTTADKCPHCGHQTTSQRLQQPTQILAMLFVILIAIGAWSQTAGCEPEEKEVDWDAVEACYEAEHAAGSSEDARYEKCNYRNFQK